MRIIYLFGLFLSLSVKAQTILNSPENSSKEIKDPVSVILANGFHSSSHNGNTFVASIGNPREENNSFINSDAGNSNPYGTIGSNIFHDTQGNIDVNSSGQLQFTLPIALPPGIKSVAPQINLIYTSGSSNGIAGYGFNLSGITSITRIGKNIEKDGEIKGIQLDYSDYYSFNGQRLILKSGEYGKDGAEYVTEKFSNVKIKSVGTITGQIWQGPQYWEVTFEDGSQAWYGATQSEINNARTPIEYNIVKWRDSQGNYISYNYSQQNNVALISSIEWGGNESLNKPHFNQIVFNYKERYLKESSFVAGLELKQSKILDFVQVNTNSSQFKKYAIHYDHGTGGSKYQFVKNITEYNANNEPANPIIFEYDNLNTDSGWKKSLFSDKDNQKLTGDFDGDGKLDFLKYSDAFKECVKWEEEYVEGDDVSQGYYRSYCVKEEERPAGIYLYRGVFDDMKQERIHTGNSLDFSKEDFHHRSVAISLKDKNGVVKPNQGVVVYKKIPVTKVLQEEKEETITVYDLELQLYSFQENRIIKEYTKKISHASYDRSSGLSSPFIDDTCINPTRCRMNEGYVRSFMGKLRDMDLDGDGLSELIMEVEDHQYTFIVVPPGYDSGHEWKVRDPNPNEGEYIPRIEEKLSNIKRYFSIDLDNQIREERSISDLGLINFNSYKISDFNGDGKMDFLKFDGGKPRLIEINKDTETHKFSATENIFYRNHYALEGLVTDALMGDFNGDGKTDLLIPKAKGSSDWTLYLSTGKGFVGQHLGGFSHYRPEGFEHRVSSRDYYYSRSYFVQDLNQDGKADFIEAGTHSKNFINKQNNYSSFIVKYKENTGFRNGELIFEKKNIDGHIEKPSWTHYGTDYRLYPYNVAVHGSQNVIQTPYLYGALSPMIGNFHINQSNHQILLMHEKGAFMVKYNHPDFTKSSRIRSITQGGLRTEIEYKELDPTKNPNFYSSIKKEQFPYMEMDKLSNSFVVAQLRQEISHNQIRKQDFRYRGFVTHLQGKGMIGFRQTARSSWYTDDLVSTKIWSGVEIDPLQEGIPIKEWAIKTNNENEIFPQNISENNTGLLSFKSTIYKTDKLLNGNIIHTNQVAQSDKAKVVTATVPIQSFTKDFQTNVSSTSTIEYGEYYLPTKTTTNINNGYSISETILEYIHNINGSGKEYFVRRPRSKTEIIRAYGDTKGAKEDYEYENNLLKFTKTYNRDNLAWIQESYTYDGFGNIIQKTISNSTDALTKTEKSQYEDKGRFVIKKTDNLGLETLIAYNNWGQVVSQLSPLGITLTNTYDTWGKLLTSKTNLGGTTSYTYEKLFNGDTKVTEYQPDGNQSITFTNKIGQNYKTTTKSFGQGKWISKEVKFDGIGRKIAESEPYYEGQGATQWNTILYDDYSRPIKATAFTGKIVETQYTSNTVTTTETNAHNKFKKQTFDALKNIISTEDKGGTIIFKYNAAGENIEAKYDTNIVTTKYDTWGRKIEFHDPSNGTYRYEYNNGFGLLTKEISPKGEKQYFYNDKGQLTFQNEISYDGTSTNKNISFSYNDKGLLTSKKGTSQGISFGSSVRYDSYGRVLSTSEENNGRYFTQKALIYDDKNRIVSYEKNLYSNGKHTKVVIENIYDAWSGTLYQTKDKSTHKILWELQETNAKGQVTLAKLGATNIRNGYDTNGFLDYISHTSQKHPSMLYVSYSFNAIKNELNSRNTMGEWNILENFVYDDNNRLINWTNPVNGSLHQNIYDKKGRIIENDQLGKISFANTNKIYQATSVNLNDKGRENLNNNIVQYISYNENNDPIFINGVRGDVRFSYGLTEMRQKVEYGGKFITHKEREEPIREEPIIAPPVRIEPNEPILISPGFPTPPLNLIEENVNNRYTKYYSEDGSFEITIDHTTGKEKHILYIGGNPYESDIIFVKNYNEERGSYKFLHKDYLGSILAISDEAGNKVEQRHYDAWGNLTHLQFGNGEILTGSRLLTAVSQLLTERGYTSHEHFFEVGIIHMNGRLYDPLLRRFLNADENIQDPHNTQNYNKYGYVYNNPLMYNDPSGEFAFLIPILGKVVAGIIKVAAIGAAVGLASYTVGLAVTGNLHHWNIGGALKATFWGAVSGVVSFGVGELFSSSLKTGLTIAESLKASIGEVGLSIVQAGTHAVSQGVLSVMQGSSFEQAFWSGALGSLGASGWNKMFGTNGASMIAFGALSGGIGAELSGGNFWEGAVIGGMIAGLNHAMHRMEQKSIAKQELNAVGIEDINAIAPNTEESLDTVLKTKTLSSMHKDSGKVGIKYGKTSQNNYLGETDSKTGKITINKSKKFSYYKLYATVGHELIHAIDYVNGTANSIFNNYLKYYKGDKTPANIFYREALEFRAYQWEVFYAPSSLSKQWYNYYKIKNGW